MFDNFVSALGDRFRQQYPQGSIISDLVQIHGDQYVVKVSVSLENTVLVSTLAADANLMLAENRAMERALTILGIRDSQQPAHEPVNLTVKPLPDLPIGLTNSVEQSEIAMTSHSLPNGANLSEPVANLVETIASRPATHGSEATSDQTCPQVAPKAIASLAPKAIESPIIIEETTLPPVPAAPDPEPIRIQVGVASGISEQPMNFDIEPSLPEPDAEIMIPTTNGKVATDSALPELPPTLSEPPIETVPEPEVTVAKVSRTKKAATTPDPLPVVTANETPLTETPLDETTVPIAEPPLSVTDMIPMINMELKRLGWSKERGREYMVSLYNKRASALLSDDELFGLLQHLQAEPVV
jgi:hypothetical protein